MKTKRIRSTIDIDIESYIISFLGNEYLSISTVCKEWRRIFAREHSNSTYSRYALLQHFIQYPDIAQRINSECYHYIDAEAAALKAHPDVCAALLRYCPHIYLEQVVHHATASLNCAASIAQMGCSRINTDFSKYADKCLLSSFDSATASIMQSTLKTKQYTTCAAIRRLLQLKETHPASVLVDLIRTTHVSTQAQKLVGLVQVCGNDVVSLMYLRPCLLKHALVYMLARKGRVAILQQLAWASTYTAWTLEGALAGDKRVVTDWLQQSKHIDTTQTHALLKPHNKHIHF